ncbi:MAG: hypothetical protein IPI67_11465 [Myxococcales bacterium]|nr:hypothetical protein [Myxococcales bacterium]
MSADSKEPRLPPDLRVDLPASERRDTLRGVGEPSDLVDPGKTDPRLRQEEFTVPPQLWRRPPSGWFRQFARTPEVEASTRASEQPESVAEVRRARPKRWVPIALIVAAIVGLFAGWRLLQPPAAVTSPAAVAATVTPIAATAVAEPVAAPVVATATATSTGSATATAPGEEVTQPPRPKTVPLAVPSSAPNPLPATSTKTPNAPDPDRPFL